MLGLEVRSGLLKAELCIGLNTKAFLQALGSQPGSLKLGQLGRSWLLGAIAHCTSRTMNKLKATRSLNHPKP